VQIIEEVADEGSSFFPTINFYDEAGNLVEPTAIKWKLTDMLGNPINARSEVVETPSGTSFTFALTGADLELLGDNMGGRILTVWGTYTSVTFGAGKSYSHQVQFNIQPRVGG